VSGWIRLDRAILDNPIWSSKFEPFTKGQAWIDILLNANYKPNFFFVRGIKISLERGQLGWSQLTMAGRWGWSPKKVKRFLKVLEEEQMVTLQTTQQTTVITICNYSKYQDLDSEATQQTTQQKPNRRPNSGRTDDPTDDLQLNNITSKQGNKRRGFTAPTLAEVNSYLSEKGCRDQKIGAAFHNYFESVGWMRGNTKMRDWKAAARNWYAKEQDMRGARSENVVEIDPRKARAKEAISAELRELMGGIGDVD
jgi:hypothetical protein